MPSEHPRVVSLPARQRILYVAPEIADFVKVGGLGDVAAALPRALGGQCDVRVLLPGYPQVLERCGPIATVAEVPAVAQLPACRLGRVSASDGLVVYVLLCPSLYERGGTPYGDGQGNDWPDNDQRFARLSLAAAELAAGAGDPHWRPDVLHLNDWPTALASGYLAWRGCRTPSVLTIHNLAYQGLFQADRAAALGIPAAAFGVEGVEFHGRLSFLKAGIYYASHVTTVSATYAEEITRPELGCGLDGLLRRRAAEGRLTGILNGIEPRDEVDWGKQANADYVRGAFGLAVSRGPLFAIISRLVHQKGIDLSLQVAETILERGGQLVVTGRGEPRLENAVRRLAARHPERVGARIGFDESEARRIYAGSDFLLMPSRYEPCGLSQMYAQRCGTLPIAHRTGGLADTIEDGRTGFLFGEFTLGGLSRAIGRALDTFRSEPRLEAMRRHAMANRHDWGPSARAYGTVYRTVA